MKVYTAKYCYPITSTLATEAHEDSQKIKIKKKTKTPRITDEG